MSDTQVVDGAGSYLFSFNDAGFAAVNFTDVDRFSVMLHATDNSDFFIRSIMPQSVPAPGALALIAVGGLMFRRCRRR